MFPVVPQATQSPTPAKYAVFQPAVSLDTKTWKDCTLPRMGVFFKYPSDWIQIGADCSQLNSPDAAVQGGDVTVLSLLLCINYGDLLRDQAMTAFATDNSHQLFYSPSRPAGAGAEEYYLVSTTKPPIVVGFVDEIPSFVLTEARRNTLETIFQNVIASAILNVSSSYSSVCNPRLYH